MNRPTIDVDDLLEIADEAIASGDQAEAVAILRKAAAIAPLRRDIKNRLALVLEGTPVTAKPAKTKSISASILTVEEPAERFEQGYDTADPAGGLDSISQIARKAFDAAAEQKSKAGDATRKLTNLLQTGLGNWKSSIVTAASRSEKTTPPIEESAVDTQAQSIVFRPEEELKQYLERAVSDETLPLDDDESGESLEEAVTTKISKPAPVSRKTARASASNKTSTKRPTDVEDVLAAGIGGFIEAASRMDKTKIVYACVYTAMVVLFGFACFDVSRKFPGLSNNSSAEQASLNFPTVVSERLTSTEALERSKSLVAEGKIDEAISLLSEQLAGGQLLHKRDLFRVELASLLNTRAEEQLKANQMAASVESYRQALSHLPGDARLQLRLANALYYFGVLGTAEASEKKKALEEAHDVVGNIIKADSKDIQAHRLQALIYDARNEKNHARASWQKVKELAPADSAILTEAKSRLK